MLNSSTTQYLYSVVNEEQRNELQHNVMKPTIQKILVEILQNYGLHQRLEAALAAGSQLLILEVGSGSGSFLRDFADLLHQHGLLEAANLNGLDLNSNYVSSAEQKNQLKPTWAKLNYYQHDIILPLEENFDLRLEKKLEFDCICATQLLEYLPNARQHLLRLYNYLKPGGVLYLCDGYLTYDGERGCRAPNLILEEFGRIGTGVVRSLNRGQIVAEESANWLREAGAEQVLSVWEMVQTGESETRSLEILRYFIALVRSVTPLLLERGVIDQAKHDQFLASVFQVDKTSFVRLPAIHTVARKPDQA